MPLKTARHVLLTRLSRSHAARLPPSSRSARRMMAAHISGASTARLLAQPSALAGMTCRCRLLRRLGRCRGGSMPSMKLAAQGGSLDSRNRRIDSRVMTRSAFDALRELQFKSSRASKANLQLVHVATLPPCITGVHSSGMLACTQGAHPQDVPLIWRAAGQRCSGEQQP